MSQPVRLLEVYIDFFGEFKTQFVKGNPYLKFPKILIEKYHATKIYISAIIENKALKLLCGQDKILELLIALPTENF